MFSFFRKSPLVIICLFFVAGVLIHFESKIELSYLPYLFITLLCLEIYLILKKRFLHFQMALLCVLSLSLGNTTARTFTRKTEVLSNKYAQVQCHIEKRLRANQYIASTAESQFLIEVENNDTLQSGDKLVAEGTFQNIAPPKLPWLFNQKKQMLSNGISLEFQIHQIISSSNEDRNQMRFLPSRIQKDLQQKITFAIQDSADAAILSALLLGDTSLLSKEITSDYSIAGVVHILAVSGMHVALIYEMILFLLKFILRKKKKWLTFFLAMSLLWTYGAITGFSASVVRACCMFSFFVISDCFLLSRKTANTIAGSTLLILCFQPYLIYNLGFLLSITAVLGIVVIHPLLIKPFYSENKVLYYLINSSSITISAQIATLPISLYIFHSFPTYFIIANLILVPWSSFILYLGIAFLFLSGIPIVGSLVTFLLNTSTSAMNVSIHLIHLLPHAQLSEINFNFEQSVLSYSLLLFIVIFLSTQWKPAIHLTGITTLLFIFYSYRTPAQFATVFTYYQSNVMLLGTEKELLLACNNDSLAEKYFHKVNLWKCQQNRSSQTIRRVNFPSYFNWKEEQGSHSFATLNHREKSICLLLNEEVKRLKIDSSYMNEFQHKKILIGQGISRKKKETITTSLTEQEINFQMLQSHPFNLK